MDLDLPSPTSEPAPSIADIPAGPASDSMQDLFDCKRAIGILQRRLGCSTMTFSDDELRLAMPTTIKRDQLGNRKFEVQS